MTELCNSKRVAKKHQSCTNLNVYFANQRVAGLFQLVQNQIRACKSSQIAKPGKDMFLFEG